MTQFDLKLTRRNTLQGMAGLVIGLALPFGGARAQGAPAATNAPFAPNAFVRVAPDSQITVLIKHIEFGQGTFTGLSTLVAEEMDADWSQIRAEHAPADVELYKNFLLGSQGTGGSTAMANSYEQLRNAGATARAMLVTAAANAWKLPASEITVDKGIISHPSGKRGTFGEFANAAAKLPVPEKVTLKDPASFRLIGKEGMTPRLDRTDKITGQALYGLDVYEPGMLTVVVARSPKFGGKVASFDASEARKVRGVVDIKQIPEGIAIYADATWPALKAREALKVEWDFSAAEQRGTEEILSDFRALAAKPGDVVSKTGAGAAYTPKDGTVIEREYVLPYLAHAPMEPLNAVLIWDGKTARARYGCQSATGDHAALAKTLGLPADTVEIETLYAGGSFGRRAQSTAHFAVELAHVAQAIGPGKPVKLVWTREDDIKGGYYRPMFVHKMRGIIRNNKIEGWHSTSVGQSLVKGTPYESMMKNGIDPTSVEGMSELLYAVPNFQSDLHSPMSPITVSWWRSVGHTHTGYAAECFIDELLEATGQDPVEGRLALMADAPRAAAALRAVAKLANWTGSDAGNGRARGVAVVKSFRSYVAQIAEVSITDDGPKVHKIWCAVDCGLAVNPDMIRAQMEGGIGYGIGHALYAEINLENGEVQEANFDSYRPMRIEEMPEIEVVIVPSTEAPTGVGEPGLPPAAPAVANAMARLGQDRPLRLPFVRQV